MYNPIEKIACIVVYVPIQQQLLAALPVIM